MLTFQVRHDPADRGDELRAGRDQVHELGTVFPALQLRGRLLAAELGLDILPGRIRTPIRAHRLNLQSCTPIRHWAPLIVATQSRPSLTNSP
ncbi:hypothetical protein [Streptomyces sp. NPDC058989]|uniref:hypothetical protein n=1 Tax=Streptomyces sp. NPDC058989 TaxID=3346686 RepID=UPI0036C808EB